MTRLWVSIPAICICMHVLRRRLAKKLKRIIGDRTQREFCREIGMTQATINRIINCEQNVTLDSLEKLANRLKIDACDLIKSEQYSSHENK